MQIKEDLEIVMMPVNEIIPYWRNPRRNDKTVDALEARLPKAGFNVPIVVDKNHVVIKGHARLRAAKRLGMEKVPVIISDVSEDIAKADRLADNKIQEMSFWDISREMLTALRKRPPDLSACWSSLLKIIIKTQKMAFKRIYSA